MYKIYNNANEIIRFFQDKSKNNFIAKIETASGNMTFVSSEDIALIQMEDLK